MSVMDDFNRFAFDRAEAKYNRAQYDQMNHDDWVALVEGYKADNQVTKLENDVEDLEDTVKDLQKELDEALDALEELKENLASAIEERDEARADLATLASRFGD